MVYVTEVYGVVSATAATAVADVTYSKASVAEADTTVSDCYSGKISVTWDASVDSAIAADSKCKATEEGASGTLEAGTGYVVSGTVADVSVCSYYASVTVECKYDVGSVSGYCTECDQSGTVSVACVEFKAD